MSEFIESSFPDQVPSPQWLGYYKFLRLIRTIFPRTFTKPVQPLAIGIDADLIAAFPNLKPSRISSFLRIYTAEPCYLTRLKDGAPRFGLDGEISGHVTSAHETSARGRKKAIKKRLKKLSPTAAADHTICGGAQ